MAPLRAAVLDFDGLVIDTESAGFAALQELYVAHGAHYALADYHQIVGTHNNVQDLVDLLATRGGRKLTLAEFEADRAAREDRRHEGLVALSGVAELLEAARARGWKLAIASSSSHRWVDPWLERLGLTSWFDTVVCRGDAPRAKPAPDLYLEALRRLGVTAGEAVAFEDSHNGSLAAKRAGLWCVAVPGPITRTQDFSHCDRVVASLAGLDLAALERDLGPSPRGCPAVFGENPKFLLPTAGRVGRGFPRLQNGGRKRSIGMDQC